MRTKTQIRNSKSKGSQFEMDCSYSLLPIFEDVIRHGKEGYQRQFDLETNKAVFECKRWKGFSWNDLIKTYKRLIQVRPEGKFAFLLFKSNLNPCLVMYTDLDNDYCVAEFESYFGVPFRKHPSTKVRK